MTEILEVLVERDRCCGYGNCVVVAPDVFTLDDEDGIVQTLDPHPRADLQARGAGGGRRLPHRGDRAEAEVGTEAAS